jgi:stage III sporulation protein AF
MMEDYVVGLVLVSIFAFISNALLPNGKMKQCTNLVFSLVLVSVMVQSFCALFENFNIVSFINANGLWG